MQKLLVTLLLNIIIHGTYSLPNELNKTEETIITKGIGPYYTSTVSIDRCKSDKPEDSGHDTFINVTAKKISRTEEQYEGVVEISNGLQMTGVKVEFLRWVDGGFKTEFKQVFDNVCGNVVISVLLKSIFNPDKNCYIEKGVYKMKPLNANQLMHLVFQSFYYGRYKIVLDYYSKIGSVGCFSSVCDIKPLKTSNKRPKISKKI